MKAAFFRRGFGISQKEIAEKIGISRETLGKKERGQSKFTREEMSKYLDVLKEYDASLTAEDIFFAF